VAGLGVTRFLATGAIAFPGITVAGVGTVAALGTGAIAFPAIGIRRQATGTARFPAFTVVGVAPVASVGAYAYVANLSNAAVTRWTRAPFRRLIALGNRYYALIDTTLYELTGDNHYDSTAISGEILTHAGDLGSPMMKSVPKMYLDARSGGEIVATPVVDEYDEGAGSAVLAAADGRIETHPIKWGRGIKGRHWALRFSTELGADFYIGQAELRTLIHDRRHYRS
jgi:hypothetical protein